MHTFTNLMYDLYQSFGLFKKGDRRSDMRAYVSFSRHQEFFGNRDDEIKRYDEISEIIDGGEVFSKEERRTFFYKYEQLYNSLIAVPVFTELSREEIKKRYATHILPRLIALDIFKTYKPDNEDSFYHHIHLFLQKKYCPCWDDKKEGSYSAAKEYLKEYTRVFSTHKENIFPIIEHIDNIREDNSQRQETLAEAINECYIAYAHIVKKNDLAVIEKNLKKIKSAHYSLTVLLNVERQLPLIKIVSKYYRDYLAHGIRPNGISEMLSRYIYKPEDHDFLPHDGIVNYIVSYYYSRVITPISFNMERESIHYIKKVKDIIFNLNSTTTYSGADLINLAIKLKNSPDKNVLKPYLDLVMLIYSISYGELEDTYEAVKIIDPNALPVGYLSSAFYIIHIALQIKLEKKKIKKGVLLSDINIIIENQGGYTDFILAEPTYIDYDNIACTNDEIKKISAKFSDSKFHQHSIFTNPNNITIMRAVRMYNHMLKRISYRNEIESNDINPDSIYGLLDKIDYALGKIIKTINKENVISSQDLASILRDKKILTKREMNKNLVGILENCTLTNCIANLSNLYLYLRSPREELNNINMLNGISAANISRRNLIYDALKILEVNDHTSGKNVKESGRIK
ncbi:MAG: hypothetical protein E6995_19950 [Enterobacteriaceae bacterium]|uniref:hypothetical protein n=1 Tax=Enterobacteriaceae TaxID=543 RepID=UPI0015DD0009|nr:MULTISPECIES: hypothetical protein [Enterobacteriaceae]MDU1246484.1 hypothetical protein [Enterobacteriaceae bacterium]MCE9794552.1 hypothetical protein [Citrobacter portucalensis]MCR3707602.1 hypothetical protein [Citrobacter freundii]MDM2882006.1 hypothetical protein [Citrobacter sp. Cpo044]BBR19705.1 hypothetical protein WP3S18E05_11850 [Klebsiella sp. WP3-S18-ESBL-05]